VKPPSTFMCVPVMNCPGLGATQEQSGAESSSGFAVTFPSVLPRMMLSVRSVESLRFCSAGKKPGADGVDPPRPRRELLGLRCASGFGEHQRPSKLSKANTFDSGRWEVTLPMLTIAPPPDLDHVAAKNLAALEDGAEVDRQNAVPSRRRLLPKMGYRHLLRRSSRRMSARPVCWRVDANKFRSTTAGDIDRAMSPP